MSHPEVHAKNSVKMFGGSVEDYLPIHHWFDNSKAHMADMRHRALKHHSAGIFECEEVFGKSIINSEGKTVYTRYIGEQHVIEDLGFIPTLEDWFENMEMQKWMMNTDQRIKKVARKGNKLPKSIKDEVEKSL
ncbi:DUF6915 family protein [Paenibacillus naphthalenovorans]|uniref:DUF6915 domain-containing protein n=1 Tax=Paenibacillus naphthalenovorans TaxID=162209 RepID=A0A0U2U6Y1_9BACL|nr:hypothetical protein [Paenibacillus naphthalenovorans]ALS22121.1 hypothetical protein IJ22_17470 [Paenibacillus naphthalenovorans]